MTPKIRLTALKRPSSRLSCIFFGAFGDTVSAGVMYSMLFATSDMLWFWISSVRLRKDISSLYCSMSKREIWGIYLLKRKNSQTEGWNLRKCRLSTILSFGFYFLTISKQTEAWYEHYEFYTIRGQSNHVLLVSCCHWYQHNRPVNY